MVQYNSMWFSALVIGVILSTMASAVAALSLSEDGPASPLQQSSSWLIVPYNGTVVTLKNAEHRRSPSGIADLYVLARGQNAFVAQLHLAANAQIPVHRDLTEETIVVLAGSGVLIMDGVGHKICPGTTVFMPADAEVSFVNGPTEFVALQIFAGPESAKKYDAWPVQ